jgi:hypothetical protein
MSSQREAVEHRASICPGRNQLRDFRVHRAGREARFPCAAPPVQPRQVSWRSCPFRAVATERRSFAHRCRRYRFSPWLRCQETRSSSRGEEFPQATRLPPSELLMVRIDAPSVRSGRFGMPSLFWPDACRGSHPSSRSHWQNPGLPWPAFPGATDRLSSGTLVLSP